jgi:hypothetical protein
MSRALLLAACVACGGATPVTSVEIPLPHADQQGSVYTIHFDHPSRVGDRSHWIVTAEEDRITTTRRGKDVVSDEHTKKRGRLDAIATTMTVDAHGGTGNILVDIADLSYSEDGRELVHKTHGRLELARSKREADAKVMLDGTEANDDVRNAAKLILTLTSGGPSDDEVMGTPVLQRIGSHWRIDGKRAAEALADEEGGEMMNGAAITGDAWLESVGAVSGVDCLDVHAIFHIDGLDLTSKVPSSVADVARITMKVSAKLPVDPSRTRVADHQLIEATIKIRTPSPNGEITLETELASRRDGTYATLSPEGGASR